MSTPEPTPYHLNSRTAPKDNEEYKVMMKALADNKRPMYVTEKQMEDARLPLYTRDFCAHLLIPLNECRAETFYLPWKCTAKRHAYIRCEAEDYERRRDARTKYNIEQAAKKK